MFVSTRGRYALRALIDLAENGGAEFIPVKDIARRQNISPKYLERILPLLSKHHLVEASSGKGGGYRLSRAPCKYSIGEILRITEGSLAPVACLNCEKKICDRAQICKTLPMWKRFDELARAFFDGINLQDLVNGQMEKKYTGMTDK